MMLTRDDIDGLPDDPDDAFAVIADKFIKFVSTKEDGNRPPGLSNTDAASCSEEVKAALEGFGVQDDYPRLFERQPPFASNDEAFFEWWRDFRAAVSSYRMRALMRRRRSAASVSLGESHRTRIHALLAHIRSLVHKLQDVSAAKKEKIFDLISKLENEVDRPRTRTEALMELILRISRVGKQVGEDAKPLIEGMERITDAFSTAKEDEEEVSPPRLPKPEETPKLPGATEPRRLEDRRCRADGLDDDIPF